MTRSFPHIICTHSYFSISELNLVLPFSRFNLKNKNYPYPCCNKHAVTFYSVLAEEDFFKLYTITLYMHDHFGPHPRIKTATPWDMKFTTLVEDVILVF